jgi:hypothetical protein
MARAVRSFGEVGKRACCWLISIFDTRPPLLILWACALYKVSLGDRSYVIKIGGGLLSRLGAECAQLKLGQPLRRHHGFECRQKICGDGA